MQLFINKQVKFFIYSKANINKASLFSNHKSIFIGIFKGLEKKFKNKKFETMQNVSVFNFHLFLYHMSNSLPLFRQFILLQVQF